MKKALGWMWLLVMTGLAHAMPVALTAADGVKVYGDFSPAAAAGASAKAPVIVAFHQAGASKAEYTPLVPRLNQAGFSVLTIDQRSGGDEFGDDNQTVAALGRSTGYDAAFQDLEAALAWGRSKANGAPVLVWGSSYSAALVFLLTAKHPAEVQGLLAFSPGEYLNAPHAVRTAARKVTVPVFVTQASDKEETEQSRRIFQAVATPTARDKVLFIPRRQGVHGSSTLRVDRNARGAEENWQAVLGFLGQFKTTP